MSQVMDDVKAACTRGLVLALSGVSADETD